MKIFRLFLFLKALAILYSCGHSDDKQKLHSVGDNYVDQSGNPVNLVDENNLKQGKWMIYRKGIENSMTSLASLASEGYYKDDKKTGYWKEYSKYGEIVDSVLYVNGVQKLGGTKTYSVSSY